MTAPQWLRSTGAATAIALSSLPMLLALPSVMNAHASLDRELAHEFVSPSAELTASVVVARPHGQSSTNK